jgi:phosphohistidine phosphatase
LYNGAVRIYLMRHATAEEAGPAGDAARRLTEGGRPEAREAGEALRDRRAVLSAVLSSPRTRARETATIVADILGVDLHVTEALDSGAPLSGYPTVISIFGQGGDVLLVGHNPEIGTWASRMAGQDLSFRPSTVACFDLTSKARLDWIRQPSLNP